MKIKLIHNSNNVPNIFQIPHHFKLQDLNNSLKIAQDTYRPQEEFINVLNAKAQNI